MEFIEVIQKRYSVRSYRRDPVEEHKLQQVLEAAQPLLTVKRKALRVLNLEC